MKRGFLTVGAPIALVFFSVLLLTFCAEKEQYFTLENKEAEEELTKLVGLLEENKKNSERNFIILQQIIKILNSAENPEKLNYLLTTYVEEHPEDLFNAYYLFVVAQNYKTRGAYPFAAHYYQRIVRNYPDLLVRGKSIHYLTLQSLISLTGEPELKVSYYKELLSRFGEEIEKGKIYYYLAQTYEKLGEWDLAMQAYVQFLNFPDTVIPGKTLAREEVEELVAFYNYTGSDWTMKSLEELVNSITWRIRQGSSWHLQQHMAKINFFAMSWERTIADPKSTEEFILHLGAFLNFRIGINSTLDRDSNQREAYLKTWGWSYRIETWYFYFRKVYFPADPERHGNWEWAGIYFGEKPFSGTEEM
jgi:tetratricopeptide (TPR) repeat protein